MNLNQLKQLTLKEVATMDDGKLGAAFDTGFRRLINDCQDRPGNDKARTITLTVTVVPTTEISEIDNRAFLDGAVVDFKFAETLPKRQSKKFHMVADQRGGLFFNDGAPENARQQSLLNNPPGTPKPIPDPEADEALIPDEEFETA